MALHWTSHVKGFHSFNAATASFVLAFIFLRNYSFIFISRSLVRSFVVALVRRVHSGIVVPGLDEQKIQMAY